MEQRRERLKRLALETIDLRKDPYLVKTALGTYECRLCLTLHATEGSYLAHSQGKKHQVNLAKRAQEEESVSGQLRAESIPVYKQFLKVGKPVFRCMQVRSRSTGLEGFLVHVEYARIAPGVTPLFRFMSAFEQRVEVPDSNFQYMVVAAEPYASIAFRLPNRPILLSGEEHFEHWDAARKTFTLQFFFEQ
jgi:splicing factor 3A subunit 2